MSAILSSLSDELGVPVDQNVGSLHRGIGCKDLADSGVVRQVHTGHNRLRKSGDASIHAILPS